MQELIQKMLRVEEDARKMVQEAQEQSKAQVAAAQREAQQEAEQQLEAARRQGREVVEQTVTATEAEKARLLEDRRQEVVVSIQVNDQDIQTATDDALKAVLG
jgi:vacuolar-type H+-ATPase subunit H